MFGGATSPGSHHPRLASARDPSYSFPSSPLGACYTWEGGASGPVGMGLITVRVVPRSGRTSVEVDERGIVVRVPEAPEGGRATEAARQALADALGVPASTTVLRRGARSRTKVFEVPNLEQREAEVRLRAT